MRLETLFWPTSTVVMTPPRYIRANEQTADTNSFQARGGVTEQEAAEAMREFEGAVETLRSFGIEVLILEPKPGTPDAHFPNNWFSTHPDGKVVLYPMHAPNRREERQEAELIALLHGARFEVGEVIRLYEKWEPLGKALEGTGSLVIDFEDRLAYAAISARTDSEPAYELCKTLGLDRTGFRTRDVQGKPIYHTNVLMAVGKHFMVVCLEVFENDVDRLDIPIDFGWSWEGMLPEDYRHVIKISVEEMNSFCGNILSLRGAKGDVIAMSRTAYNGFTEENRTSLERFGEFAILDIPTIERLGGGSARCMIAEVFLPRAIRIKYKSPTL